MSIIDFFKIKKEDKGPMLFAFIFLSIFLLIRISGYQTMFWSYGGLEKVGATLGFIVRLAWEWLIDFYFVKLIVVVSKKLEKK